MTALLERRAADVMRRSFAPPTRLTCGEWANRYGWIAKSSGASESGPYSTDRAPYLREILDVMGDEAHQDVVFNKPAQVGFTECLNQFVGFCMAEDPSGLIVIQPDIDMAKAWMKERVDTMLAESPRLRGIVRSEGGRRVSDDTMQRKVFPGGWLVVVGANAPSKLRSRPARRILGDERSGWTLDARQQGDPWDLAGERTATFWNAKRIQGSTPGEEGTCPITEAIAKSDFREFHVACPACGHREPFQWRTPEGVYRLQCDRDAANELIPETVRYLCTACGALIPEAEKPRMLRSGAWLPRFPGRRMAGFDLNGLISPWRAWTTVMRLWLEAQGNHERLKVFVTHVLAQPWRPITERIDVHVLMERATEPAEAPPEAALCTGFIDVQSNRLSTLVVAWGAGEEGWVLDWHEPSGDPTRDPVWDEAWEWLLRPRGAPLAAVGVDTGFLKDVAWRHVDRWHGRNGVRVLGTKGEDGRGRSIITRPAPSPKRRARPPWILGVDTVKDLLSLRLRHPVPPGGPGALHFAESLPSSYFEQLTAEELRTVLVQGRPTRAWRPIKAGAANEALDLTVGALAMLHALGPRVIATLGAMAAARAAQSATVADAPALANDAPKAAPRRSRWVNSFGGW